MCVGDFALQWKAPTKTAIVCCANFALPLQLGDERRAKRRYFLSLVWSTGEVLTVGSDIYPVTDYERAYQLISRIISGVVYAYLLGAVCSIFTAMSRDQSKYYEDMDHLNKFLREKHLTVIDPNLCGSLRLFYRFAHQAQGSAQHMHEVLNCISPTLRGKIAWRVRSPSSEVPCVRTEICVWT